jgi:hypothetical protein
MVVNITMDIMITEDVACVMDTIIIVDIDTVIHIIERAIDIVHVNMKRITDDTLRL